MKIKSIKSIKIVREGDTDLTPAHGELLHHNGALLQFVEADTAVDCHGCYFIGKRTCESVPCTDGRYEAIKLSAPLFKPSKEQV